jgi:hypothetical protein
LLFDGLLVVVKMVSLGRAAFWWEAARFFEGLIQPGEVATKKALRSTKSGTTTTGPVVLLPVRSRIFEV